jgi:hypothetical protein
MTIDESRSSDDKEYVAGPEKALLSSKLSAS